MRQYEGTSIYEMSITLSIYQSISCIIGKRSKPRYNWINETYFFMSPFLLYYIIRVLNKYILDNYAAGEMFALRLPLKAAPVYIYVYEFHRARFSWCYIYVYIPLDASPGKVCYEWFGTYAFGFRMDILVAYGGVLWEMYSFFRNAVRCGITGAFAGLAQRHINDLRIPQDLNKAFPLLTEGAQQQGS